jgi:transposase
MELQAENAFLRQENAWLKFELAELKRSLYGTKSERNIPENPDQLQLPIEGLDVRVEKSKPAEEQITYTRKKQEKSAGLPVRTPIPDHIPRQTTVIEPEGIDLEHAVKIGEEITEYLDYTPSKIFVRQIIRYKYKIEDQIVIAELPSQPIAKSNVGAGLLAHILVNKYADHLPLYRQRKQFLRERVDIAESTLNDWVNKGSRLLEPLFEVLINQVKQSDYLQADETAMPVLSQDKPGSTHKGYFWGYYSPVNKTHCFVYDKSRGKEAPAAFLKEFKGYLQSDGYGGYNQFENKKDITLTACMAHARRKFEHALDQDKERAEYVLKQIRKLYATERKAREQGFTVEQRHELRGKESVPVLDELQSWFTEQLPHVLPKSAIGVAINYTMGLWKRLRRYTTNGILEIDNNLIENKMRPVALGRKNYLFAGSHEAAQRSAMVYSFFATCILHDVNPEEWLTDVLSCINDYNILNLADLLPQNWKAARNKTA